jgi:hypothetical protein
MAKIISLYWDGKSGDSLTLSITGEAVGTSTVSVSSDPHTGLVSRRRIITFTLGKLEQYLTVTQEPQGKELKVGAYSKGYSLGYERVKSLS